MTRKRKDVAEELIPWLQQHSAFRVPPSAKVSACVHMRQPYYAGDPMLCQVLVSSLTLWSNQSTNKWAIEGYPRSQVTCRRQVDGDGGKWTTPPPPPPPLTPPTQPSH
jgi:hypothetical protein